MTASYFYELNDLFTGHIPWATNEDDEFQKSKFDQMLCSAWDRAEESGYFWYSLNDLRIKRIAGKIGLIAQLNTKRFSERRKPVEISSVQQHFDKQCFNFTKVKDHEILFRINSRLRNEKANEAKVNEENLIVINVSPIDYGHTLLVPDVRGFHPQVVTLDSMQLAIDLCLLSKHRGFRIGFNSLCAYASVNHLHYHILYIHDKLPVDTAEVSFCGSGLYELNNYFIRGFVLQLANHDSMFLAKRVNDITSYFYDNEIPYNMLISRASFKSSDKPPSNHNIIKVFIFPKHPAPGIKDTKHMNSCCFDVAGYLLLKVNSECSFNPAALELCGFLPIKEEEEFNNLTEIEAVRILNKYSYTEDEFEELKNQLTFILQNLVSD